jgi:hypothetical protein
VDVGERPQRRDGAPLQPNSMSARFGEIVDRLGLPSVTFHGLRHTTPASSSTPGWISSPSAGAWATPSPTLPCGSMPTGLRMTIARRRQLSTRPSGSKRVATDTLCSLGRTSKPLIALLFLRAAQRWRGCLGEAHVRPRRPGSALAPTTPRYGLADNLGLVIAKTVHGELASDVPPADAIRLIALFGARNRDGWSVSLTILTALANLLPVLPEEESYFALFHDARRVTAECEGQAPRQESAALASRPVFHR